MNHSCENVASVVVWEDDDESSKKKVLQVIALHSQAWQAKPTTTKPLKIQYLLYLVIPFHPVVSCRVQELSGCAAQAFGSVIRLFFKGKRAAGNLFCVMLRCVCVC